jgi:hypothetical protein
MMRRSLRGCFKDGSPAENWYDALDVDTIKGKDWTAILALMKDEFGDPNEQIRLRSAYADCTPRSGKHDNFVQFIDAKVALRTKILQADPSFAAELPELSVINTIIGFLPPDARQLAKSSDLTTFAKLRAWAKPFFSIPRTAAMDPCLDRKRGQEESRSQPHPKKQAISTNSQSKDREMRSHSGSGSTSKTSSSKSSSSEPNLPDGNKEPPGNCKHCGKLHWSIYCWNYDKRRDPPSGKEGKYGRPKPRDFGKKTGNKQNYAASSNEYELYSSDGYGATGYFQ